MGRANESPEFGKLAWFSMLFAAGMGGGLLFYGVAEPLTHFTSAPNLPSADTDAARWAMVLTAFHWGFHAWTIYGISGLVIAYFGFRLSCPYLPGAVLEEAFKARWIARLAFGSNLVAIVAVAFGLAASVALGTSQLRSGLSAVAGTPSDSVFVSLVVLVALVICYMTSAATGLHRGIKWLSNVNMILVGALMAFVAIVGPTAYMGRVFINASLDYLRALPELSLGLYPDAPNSQWYHDWTLTYFLWWIAWTPFVGVFIARISRGRTIREFVIGVLLAPTVFCLLAFSILGGAAFHRELEMGGGLAASIQHEQTGALFALLATLPFDALLSVVAIVTVFLFLVTSFDSATFVMAMLSSEGALDPPKRRRMIWGVGLGALGTAVIMSGNLTTMRALGALGAFPFLVIICLQVAGLLKVLRAAPPELERASLSVTPE